MLTKLQFFYDHTTKQALGFQNPFYLKKAQQLEPKIYDGNVIKNTSAIVIPDPEETLILAEESRSKMLLKQQDPMMLEKKVNTKPVDYVNSMNSSEPTLSVRPTKVEVPKELPKVSMVNTSLKKLKHHLAGFDVVVKERTTAQQSLRARGDLNIQKLVLGMKLFHLDNSSSNQSAPSFDQYFKLNELKAQSQKKDTVIKKLKERIKSLSGKVNEDKIKKDLKEIETINIELDHRVSNLIADNENLKQTCKQIYDSIKPARIRSKEQCNDSINQVNLKSAEISDLNARLQENILVITALRDDLRKLKGKALVDNAVTKHAINPKTLKIDVEPITPKLLNNRTAHSTYIKHTREEAAVLKDLVEHVKANYPLDHPLDSACSGYYPKEQGQKRVKQSTSASGSQPSSNNKKVKEFQVTIAVHSKLNANSKPLCVKCNGCTLSDNHDLCVLDFINNVNARVKSKSVKKSSKRKVWKPIGKVVQIVLWYLDSGCSKHMTGDRSQLTNLVNKFLGTVKFRNDHVAKILGYGDYQIGNVMISRVYYVEGLRHNLFFVGQFCDSNLEVAFRQHTCFIRNLEDDDILTGS
ncbi:hypothetical protein Tco_1202210 [Tanacetum coccineum]